MLQPFYVKDSGHWHPTDNQIWVAPILMDLGLSYVQEQWLKVWYIIEKHKYLIEFKIYKPR